MKLLITGISGQLGSELRDISNHENYGIDLITKEGDKNIFKMDLGGRERVIAAIERIKPDWIIHCAAMSSVDKCETDIENAWKSNVIGTKNIVDVCNRFGSKLVFLSTDYVFDGTRGFYKENDVTNPINFYGKTKLIGEWLVRTVPESIIIRTSTLLSNKPRSLLSWILQNLEKGFIDGATDMKFSPTSVPELAKAILDIIKEDTSGVYHMACDEVVTRYELMQKVAKVFDYDVSIVKPTSIKQIGFKALRPNNTSLDITKAKKMGLKFSKIDDILKEFKRKIN